jgi:predicted Zn-dependent protease
MPAVSSGNSLNAQREQISDEAMVVRLRSQYDALANDLNVVLIAITPIDLYSEGDSFIFGQRRGPTEAEYWLGIISYWRMDPVSFGDRPDRELLEERLTKLVLKYVLTMYSDRPESSDPTSVLYNRLFSLDALDGVELAVPPQ